MKEIYRAGAERMAAVFTDMAVASCKSGKGILVFVHKSVDGDCVGSACAACLIFASLGAKAKVAMPEELPETMNFMGVKDLLLIPGTDDGQLTEYGYALVTDCAESHRMGVRGELFESFDDPAIVDHHELTGFSGDNKWILPQASSASEMIYCIAVKIAESLKRPLGDILDPVAAGCILTGIVTDTGRFTYSNTLEAAGVLAELGGSITDVCHNLFDRKRVSQFFLSNTVCSKARLLCGGRLAIAAVTRAMFNDFNACDGDIDDVVSRLRDIDGVELAVVLRETPDGTLRGNLRSKTSFDCSLFAGNYGGGGHKRAAGFTVEGITIGDLYEDIIKKAESLL